MKGKIVMVLAMLVVPMLAVGWSSADDGCAGGYEDILIWEAHAKGLAQVHMANYVGIQIDSDYGGNVIVDDYAMLMSPGPYEEWIVSSQDGCLTPTSVEPEGSTQLYYGSWVTATDDPYGSYLGADSQYAAYDPWWCTEHGQTTRAGVEFTLTGEIASDVMVEIIESDDPYMDHWGGPFGTVRNYDIWDYLADNGALVVGKTPLWTPLLPDEEAEVRVDIAVTNIGGEDVVGAEVRDTIPTGYSYDPDSFSVQPADIISNPDGSTDLVWYVDADGFVVTSSNEPNVYDSEFISYTLVVPPLELGSRIFLPPATTLMYTQDGDEDRAHSAQPLLEVPRLVCKGMDGPEVVPTHTPQEWTVTIRAWNPFDETMTDVRVEDRFGGEFAVEELAVEKGDVEYKYRGKTEKVYLRWDIGELEPGEMVELVLHVTTDHNPAGKQEFTSPGTYTLNSGAVLKGNLYGHQVSYVSEQLYVTAIDA